MTRGERDTRVERESSKARETGVAARARATYNYRELIAARE